jgi:hypothetical protein
MVVFAILASTYNFCLPLHARLHVVRQAFFDIQACLSLFQFHKSSGQSRNLFPTAFLGKSTQQFLLWILTADVCVAI